ncbi:AAA family ATPase, partial [Terrisporobacter sp.]|uniref:AAA family ATPase n=1 Tax=Terrisporobacter sp. TaxID=1965305 RepID=UPI002A7F83FF
RRAPYSVVLFDEIEKAHEDVFNMFLQILDDGRLTDNKGKTVDFKNTIIIMTSNIGSSYLLEDAGHITETTKDLVMSEMKRRFKPEFLNRVDDIIMFKSLDKEEIKKIIDIFIKSLANRLKEKDIDIEITDAAKEIMVREGYDPVYGARPLKRYIGNTLETMIARRLIAGEIYNGCTIVVDGEDDNISIKVK